MEMDHPNMPFSYSLLNDMLGCSLSVNVLLGYQFYGCRLAH